MPTDAYRQVMSQARDKNIAAKPKRDFLNIIGKAPERN